MKFQQLLISLLSFVVLNSLTQAHGQERHLE